MTDKSDLARLAHMHPDHPLLSRPYVVALLEVLARDPEWCAMPKVRYPEVRRSHSWDPEYKHWREGRRKADLQANRKALERRGRP
jgi:hypothetical protein